MLLPSPDDVVRRLGPPTIPSGRTGPLAEDADGHCDRLHTVAKIVDRTLDECGVLLAKVPTRGTIDQTAAYRADVEERIVTLRRAGRAAGDNVHTTMCSPARRPTAPRTGSAAEVLALLEATWQGALALRRELQAQAQVRVGSAAAAEAVADRCRSLLADAARGPCTAPGARRRTSRTRALVLAALAILGAGVSREFVAAPYTVAYGSMEPGLADGDRLVVNKLAYRLRPPKRGDVVAFDSGALPTGGTGETYVKRVIGIAGDTVEARDGVVLVNGVPAEDTALDSTQPFGPVQVPPEMLFVLGDNRTVSVDSRAFGMVPVDAVVGEVSAVIWPLDRAGGL